MKRAASHARLYLCLFASLAAAGSWLLGGSGVLAATEPHITAQYAVVVDADTGQVLYDKDMDTPTAPASLTKIFTAAVALSSESLDKVMTVDSYDLVGESSMGLSAGQKVTLRTLLYGMMLPSGNDAAMTVAQNLGAMPGDTPQQSIDRFMERVNATDARLGLQHTKLITPHGLDTPGHQTTARDIAAMTMFALRNPDFRTIIGTPSYQAEGFDLVQANRLLGSYPGLIGGKTGITDNAGYCLMEAAERDGHTIITVLLKSTPDAWYTDASTLLDYGFDLATSGAVPPGLPTISLAPSAPPVQQPVVNAGASTPAGLTVQQVSEHEAVVAHHQLKSVTQLSWRWPLAAIITMLAATLLALNYSLLFALAGIGWHHRPRLPRRKLRRPRAHRAVRRHNPAPRPVMGGSQPLERHHAPAARAREIPLRERRHRAAELDAPAPAQAQVFTARGVRLAAAGRYRSATDQFLRALEVDEAHDLARSPGFWSMDTAGYLAAARAYARRDRLSDARSLLTIVKLGCDSRRELEALLQEVVAPSR